MHACRRCGEAGWKSDLDCKTAILHYWCWNCNKRLLFCVVGIDFDKSAPRDGAVDAFGASAFADRNRGAVVHGGSLDLQISNDAVESDAVGGMFGNGWLCSIFASIVAIRRKAAEEGRTLPMPIIMAIPQKTSGCRKCDSRSSESFYLNLKKGKRDPCLFCWFSRVFYQFRINNLAGLAAIAQLFLSIQRSVSKIYDQICRYHDQIE